jgi:hypothetical protein
LWSSLVKVHSVRATKKVLAVHRFSTWDGGDDPIMVIFHLRNLKDLRKMMENAPLSAQRATQTLWLCLAAVH